MDLSQTQHIELRDPTRIRRLSGFGRVTFGDCYVYEPESVEGVEALLALAENQGVRVVLRGAGRSYGDASVLPEALALSLAKMDSILSWDAEHRIVHAEAGIPMSKLCAFALSVGHWPPAVGGIGAPTLGGAVANNIHGKNHWMDGAMAEHIEEIELVSPKLGRQVVTAADPAFSAIVGGLGLLGVITSVKLRLLPVPSQAVDVVNTPLKGWSDHFREFESDEPADAIVSWIDGFSRRGRGIFERGVFAPEANSELPPAPGMLSKHAWRILKALANPPGMRLASAARYRLSRMRNRHSRMHVVKFNHPLDSLEEWERAYLPYGLVQFQGFIPADASKEVVPVLSEMALRAKLPSYLSVLKRHRPSNSLLNPYGDSYSLAMDFKVTKTNSKDLERLFHSLTKCVVEARGNVYLAKDQLLTADEFRHSLGREPLEEHSRWRDVYDPNRLLASSQSIRLGL